MTTIAEKLTTIKNALNDIKNSIIAKGQTPTGDITTYATSIDNIESGSSEFIGIPKEVSSAGVYGFPVENFTFKLPSNAKDLSKASLYCAFQDCTSLTSVDLSSLTTISSSNALTYAFRNCTSLTSVGLSSLTTISGSNALYGAFQDCTSLTSLDLSNLIAISSSNALYGAFRNCTSLTSLDLSSLTTISGSGSLSYAFYSCKALTELSFPALTSSSFGSYTNQFNSMLSSVSGCTVHFPSNLESVISSWGDVTAGFGGTNTTVLFDLPATK